MTWCVKVGLPTEGNEFADANHVGEEHFETAREAFIFTTTILASGYKANVWDGIRHVGTYEG